MTQYLNAYNQQELKSFKRLYNKSKKEGKEIFKFKGQDILVSYAKYMLEYVEMVNKEK